MTNVLCIRKWFVAENIENETQVGRLVYIKINSYLWDYLLNKKMKAVTEFT